ncbi:MAG: PKD domain-containing protein [Candidatus Bathyarchaeota archaeon]|nr:MAG: PKD domain-containing protein [Candidatus Bathyarchaeota archaeon]
MKIADIVTLLLFASLLSSSIIGFTHSRARFDNLSLTLTKPGGFYYELREIVEFHGTVKFINGSSVSGGLVGVHVRDSIGANLMVRTIPSGLSQQELGDIEIIDVHLEDSLGNLEDEFEREEQVNFWIAVRNRGIYGTRNVTVAITFFDSMQIPLACRYARAQLLPTAMLNWTQAINLPHWASVGNAQTYISVLTDWPKDGGYPYVPEKPINYTIIESEYIDPPTNVIPQSPVENGEYNTTFRLSPEPRNGTYTVDARATYVGYTSQIASTTFHVNDVTAPPIASFTAEPPLAPSPGYDITFYGGFSSAEGYNDSITNYFWDFGDGNQSTGLTVTHGYADFGNYTVTLNVTDSEGYWNTTSKTVRVAEIHDISLTDIKCSTLYSDWHVIVKIDVKNKGSFAETFNITARYNSSIIDIVSVVDLQSFEERTITIDWNTTALPMYVSYVISAEADILIGEPWTEDNFITYGILKTRGLGDVDADHDVDIFDIVKLSTLYGKTSGDPDWNMDADIQPDGVIDIFDVVIAAGKYGTVY